MSCHVLPLILKPMYMYGPSLSSFVWGLGRGFVPFPLRPVFHVY